MPAQNSVTVDDQGVIHIVAQGKQTAESVRKLVKEVDAATKQATELGKQPFILCDITALSINDIGSEARVEAKRLSIQSTRTALIGTGRLMSIMTYLYRTSSKTNIRFFTDERKGRRWLFGQERTKKAKPTVSLVSGIVIILIGLLALVGWQIGNEYLTRWIPTLRPINPLAAGGLIATGIGFIFYYIGKLNWLKVAGVFGVLLGVAALLPLGIDGILFGEKLKAAGAHTNLADSAAWCFIAIGVSPFTVGTRRFAVRIAQYILAGTILGLSLLNIFGQLYAQDFIYNINDSFVMAFNLAVAFFMAGATLVLIILFRQVGDVLERVTRLGWLIMFAVIGVQLLTYGAWYQADSRNRSDSSSSFMEQARHIEQTIDQRRQAYIDTLYGFRGLFAASESVDQGEFQAYYDSLDLPQTYPGIRSLSFISKVGTKDLDSFTAKQRADRSLHKDGNPGFAITNKTEFPQHYIVTFVATGPTNGGSDLGATPSRLHAFEKADATGQPTSSGTVDFAATATTTAQRGFFLTIPVSQKGDSTKVVGFVNAVFNYDDFFTQTLKGIDMNGLNVTVQDDTTSLYASNGAMTNTTYSYASSIAVADRTWRVNVSAPNNYGISQSQVELPIIILWGGQFFSVLMIMVFVMQNRARQRALDLAASITEDLHQERDVALSNERKSNAILASIGDAVFAIDARGRITLFNPAAVHVSGYTEAEALGQPYDKILKFVLEKDGKPNHHFIQRALDGHISAIQQPTQLIRKDGKKVAVADSAAPIRDAKGKTRGVIVVFRDVTQEQALEKAKGEFVSLASHQLRTPLSAINWFSEMLINGDAGKLTKTQGEYLREIYEGNQRMVELVDSLLNVSRLEVGKLKNDPQPTAVNEIADSLLRELQTSITSKNLEVSTKVDPKLPTVFADPKLLRMVLQNLLSNAVKYTTDKGKVGLVMREATTKDATTAKLRSGHYLYIAVADTGYGIPEAQQGKIFQKLFRADNVRKLDVEGTGLGLYIVKEVAEKLGGAVWFQSVEGKGTTFYVMIPFKTRAS